MKATLLVLALAFAGCSKDTTVTASVDCDVKSGPTLVCMVKQSDAKARHEVCFDFAVTCPNGASLAAPHTCASVNGSIPTERSLTADHLTITGDCAGEKTAKVTNLTLDGKPVQ